MGGWTRKGRILPLVVMVLIMSDCHLRAAAAGTKLEALQEVQDALDHADQSLSDLRDLVTGIISTEETNITTAATSASSPPPSTTIITTSPTKPPPTTTTTTPITITITPTTATVTTTKPTTTTTTKPTTTTTKLTTTTTPKPTTTTTTTTTTKPTPKPTTTTTTTTTTKPTPKPTTTTTTKPTPKPTTTTTTKPTPKPTTTTTTTTTTKPTTTTTTTTTKPPTKPTANTSKMINDFDNGFMVDWDTETPAPWWMRVNLHLRNMEELTVAIGEGRTDVSHARLLDEEAAAMDDLVDDGADDPCLVTEGEVDYELYQSVQSSLKNSSDLVDELIADAKADKVELIVTLVLLSVFFVVVLTGLIIALIRPWAKRSGLKPNRSQKAEGNAVAKDEGRTFPDAIFVQHSHVNMDPYSQHDSKI